MVRQDYNQLAHAYGRNRTLHPVVLKHLLSIGMLDRTSRVLEIGCGTGNYINEIAAETGADCTGIDPSYEMLRIARSNHGLPTDRQGPGDAKVTFVEGQAEKLPLSDEQFDLAFSVDVIHHVQRRDGAAIEVSRVLKPDGIVVVVTESEVDIRHRTPQVTHFPETIDVELNRYPTINTIERELTAAGLLVDARIPVSMPHEVTDLRPYCDKAFSSLHLIPDDAFSAGIARMEQDLRLGPIRGHRRYTMVVGRRR